MIAPSRLSARAVAYRETVQHGMAIVEALRRSGSSCLSRPVITMLPNWTVRKRTVIQGGLLAELWRVGEGWAGLQRHPNDLAVVDHGKYRPQIYPELRCLLCNDCSGFTAAIEVEQHFLATQDGLCAFDPVHQEANICVSSVGLWVSTTLSTSKAGSLMS